MTNNVNNSTHLNVKRCVAYMLAALLSISVVACATMEGAGKDIEAAGEEIQDAADDN